MLLYKKKKKKKKSIASEVVDELFESLCSKYQVNLETEMRWNDYIFDSVQLIHYKCHRGNLIRGGSYIDIPDLVKKKNIFCS